MYLCVYACIIYVHLNPTTHVYRMIYIHTRSMYAFEGAVKEHNYLCLTLPQVLLLSK